MSASKLVVKFGLHITPDRAAGMTSGIAAYGNVFADSTGRELVVEVFRKSKMQELKDQLAKWESYGFLQWNEESEAPSEPLL